MSTLRGKMINQIEIKSDEDVFHQLLRHNPHNISSISADKVHACELHEGQWGNVSSVIGWNFTHDGKKKFSKHKITAIDEDKKLVTFKLIEGDNKELYKTFIITVHVEAHGNSKLVTWTFEYEKVNENVPYPTTLMDLCLHVTKDIETHHLK